MDNETKKILEDQDKKEMKDVADPEEVEKTGKSDKDYPGLVDQIKTEYEMAWKHQNPKKKQAEVRLKLYNNQKRDPKAVGDTTLFTIMQTVLASLYDDRLMVSFGGREDGDEETAENLDAMAEFDYGEMQKDIIDYDWDFDTCFFGRGILAMEEYYRDADKNQFFPIPRTIDPLIFLRDPDATSINGKGRSKDGAARFMGYPVKMTGEDIENNPHSFKGLKESEIKSGTPSFSLLQDAIDARNDAQNRGSTTQFENESKLGSNTQYESLVWYTFYKGKRVKVWLTNERTKLVGVQEIKKDYWPLVDRALFPTAHDWDGVSIPDLVEDKQRARAVLANLGLNSIKADLYPMYAYDSNKITNRKDLAFGFNKFIPIDAKGENINTAIAPFQKSSPNMGLLDYIYNALDISAQKATATPDIQQGIQSEQNRPLGETNLVKVGVDTRYSLAAKIFGWSETDFWIMWYDMYEEYFEDDIDEKILRLVGAFGPKWRGLSKNDFITRLHPDIIIESRAVNRAKQIEERQAFTAYFNLILQNPTVNRRYAEKKLGKLYGLKKDELDRLFPPTIDERIAEDENEKLNEDKFVGVLREDDHNVHLEMHSKARDTKAAKAHIETHKRALSIKKTNPEFFPEDKASTEFQQGGAPSPSGSVTSSAPQLNKPIQPSATSGVM